MKILFILILVFFLWSVMVPVPVGTVIAVTDGATVTVMGEGTTPFKVRLEGDKKDHYGRTTSRLFVDDIDVSAAMVEQGAAWVYRRYTQDPVLYRAEKKQKKAAQGFGMIKMPFPLGYSGVRRENETIRLMIKAYHLLNGIHINI